MLYSLNRSTRIRFAQPIALRNSVSPTHRLHHAIISHEYGKYRFPNDRRVIPTEWLSSHCGVLSEIGRRHAREFGIRGSRLHFAHLVPGLALRLSSHVMPIHRATNAQAQSVKCEKRDPVSRKPLIGDLLVDEYTIYYYWHTFYRHRRVSIRYRARP